MQEGKQAGRQAGAAVGNMPLPCWLIRAYGTKEAQAAGVKWCQQPIQAAASKIEHCTSSPAGPTAHAPHLHQCLGEHLQLLLHLNSHLLSCARCCRKNGWELSHSRLLAHWSNYWYWGGLVCEGGTLEAEACNTQTSSNSNQSADQVQGNRQAVSATQDTHQS